VYLMNYSYMIIYMLLLSQRYEEKLSTISQIDKKLQIFGSPINSKNLFINFVELILVHTDKCIPYD
jgi:hypothetical protein